MSRCSRLKLFAGGAAAIALVTSPLLVSSGGPSASPTTGGVVMHPTVAEYSQLSTGITPPTEARW